MLGEASRVPEPLEAARQVSAGPRKCRRLPGGSKDAPAVLVGLTRAATPNQRRVEHDEVADRSNCVRFAISRQSRHDPGGCSSQVRLPSRGFLRCTPLADRVVRMRAGGRRREHDPIHVRRGSRSRSSPCRTLGVVRVRTDRGSNRWCVGQGRRGTDRRDLPASLGTSHPDRCEHPVALGGVVQRVGSRHVRAEPVSLHSLVAAMVTVPRDSLSLSLSLLSSISDLPHESWGRSPTPPLRTRVRRRPGWAALCQSRRFLDIRGSHR